MANKNPAAFEISVAADEGQPNKIESYNIISDNVIESNSYDEYFRQEMLKSINPYYLQTVSMNKLYDTVYQSKPPIIDGLLYPGTYLFAGAPKIGKSFLMAQLAYHVSTGAELWGYSVRKGSVLYLALEDDYRSFVLCEQQHSLLLCISSLIIIPPDTPLGYLSRINDKNLIFNDNKGSRRRLPL